MTFESGHNPPNKGKGAAFLWLMAHVNHKGGECLIWPFNRMPNKGYGTLGYKGKVWKAHRLMCVLAHGEPPTPEHHAAHSCGRGHDACVHPEHVSWKTPRENRLDSNLHGTGNVPKPRRLTFDQVQEIRGKGDHTLQSLADEYGVHPDTISRIRNGKFWAKPRSTLTRDQIAKITELRETMSLAAAAREVGVKYMIAHRYFNRQTFVGVERSLTPA